MFDDKRPAPIILDDNFFSSYFIVQYVSRNGSNDYTENEHYKINKKLITVGIKHTNIFPINFRI